MKFNEDTDWNNVDENPCWFNDERIQREKLRK
jgi:hypothetical protein